MFPQTCPLVHLVILPISRPSAFLQAHLVVSFSENSTETTFQAISTTNHSNKGKKKKTPEHQLNALPHLLKLKLVLVAWYLEKPVQLVPKEVGT